MKIVLLHDAKNAGIAEALRKSFKKPKKNAPQFEVELFALSEKWQDDGAFIKTIKNSTHIVVFFSKESLWLDFVAGFAAGKGAKLILFPSDKFVPPAVFEKTQVFNENAQFFNWFKTEIEEFSVKESREQAKKALLTKGIPVLIDSFAGMVSGGDLETAALFIKAGFDANEYNKNGVPLLCLAARAGNLAMVQFLLKEGASVNSISRDRGSTAIVDAALGKHGKIISCLIKAGANVNVKSKDGQSALIIAVGLSDTGSIRLLIKAGADADAPDNLGASARKYAALLKKQNILDILGSNAADTAKTDGPEPSLGLL